jgi:hypothetical protein
MGDVVMLMTVAGLPAAIGAAEAIVRRRRFFGWIINILAAMAGGVALMLVAVSLGDVPFSEAHQMSEVKAGAIIFSGLIGGALAALWLVNRFR